MGGGTALEEPAPITRDPAQAWALRSLLATEPSVEEKLQKLHSEIKFALKVDNPVRPSSGCRGHVSVPLPPHRSSSLRRLGTLRQSQAARQGRVLVHVGAHQIRAQLGLLGAVLCVPTRWCHTRPQDPSSSGCFTTVPGAPCCSAQGVLLCPLGPPRTPAARR